MSQHTPGPWLVDAEHAGLFEQDQARFWINAEGTHVAYVDGPRNDERTANAHLIGAAPDLLEALQACDEAMAYMSEYDIPLHLPFRVKAAIAKATGGAV